MTDSRYALSRGQIQGFGTEEKFFDAAQIINDGKILPRPDWLTRIDCALPDEDLSGTDAWAYTDKGRIAIQIKSSVGGANHHTDRHPEWDGLIFVLSDITLYAEEIAEVILEALNGFYKEIE